jgi:hypothetical protein
MIKIDLDPAPRILRQFSWIALFAFALLGLVLHWNFGLPWTWVGVLAGFGVLTFACGILLGFLPVPRAVFVGLSIVAIPIGFVLSWVLVGLVYYVLFTLFALAFRLMGRDALRRRLDPEAGSYWLDRGAPRPAASYFKLY